MRLWVDDQRSPRDWLPHIRWFRERDPGELDDWLWVKTAQEAITHLESEDVVEVSLDHDLGDPDEFGDGYMVAVWIEERVAADNTYVPPVVQVHSSNVPRGKGSKPQCEVSSGWWRRDQADTPAKGASAEDRLTECSGSGLSRILGY